MSLRRKKIDADEVVSLLERITEGATSDKASLNEVLRLCMRLSKQLNNEELMKWVQAELNGYPSRKELPDYRVLPSQVMGHFSGWGGSSLRNASIPQLVIDEEDREWLFTNYLTEPVATLEQLANQGDKSEVLKANWPADIVAMYQDKEIYQGYVLIQAWRMISKASITGILDNVRTRILEFVLRIEEEIDVKKPQGSDGVEVTKPSPQKVSQIVNNTIYGGNVAVGNSGDTIQHSIQVQAGDLNSLKEYLNQLGLTEKLVDELEIALANDSDAKEQPGTATSSWLGRVMILIGKGSLSVASNATGSLVATAVMRYLGLPT